MASRMRTTERVVARIDRLNAVKLAFGGAEIGLAPVQHTQINQLDIESCALML